MNKLAFAVSILTTLGALGAEVSAQASTWHEDLEWNTSLAAFGGVGFNLGVKPAAAPRLRVHAGGFALTLPEFGQGPNRGLGWSVSDRALLAGGQWYFRDRRGGFFAGLDVVYQQRFLQRAGQPNEARLDQGIVAAIGGFEWFPSDSLGLYLTPNLTVAATLLEKGQPSLGGLTYQEGKILPLPGVVIGWEL